ncbi:hypothetical protein A2389_03505 [Candidatus Adlerbacteria bacterium RIFOXYB1_FULL_48_10]|nr:MAG: hypothetical protein A2389_03505 [Candidatus Adlerbacteria bacterium RIFOXYB1_FULL_48_10]
MILIGAANLFSRAFNYVGGTDAVQTAFQPLGTLGSSQGFASAFPNVSLVATTTPITPTHVKIPSIGVDANIEQVGKKDDGSMETPKSFQNIGWYTLGPKPGAAGNAVMAGHVNNALTTSGVFEHLSDVKVGDYITVEDSAGRTLIYIVHQTAQYNLDSAPVADIFSQTGPTQLVLITCDGAWDAEARSYNKRLVVYAKLTNK